MAGTLSQKWREQASPLVLNREPFGSQRNKFFLREIGRKIRAEACAMLCTWDPSVAEQALDETKKRSS